MGISTTASVPVSIKSDSKIENSYLPAIDGVRGLAILLVLLVHLGAILRDTPFAKFMTFGWIGVDLFFVLSGFLITRILLGTKAEKGYYRRFYIRRGLRIWPLYYAFIAATLFLLHFLPHFTESFPHSRVSSLILLLFFLQNLNPATLFCFRDTIFSVTWSLCIEEHFYLIWPGFVRNFGRRALLLALATILTLSPLFRIATYLALQNVPNSDWYQTFVRFTPLHLDPICAGCILALLNVNRGTSLGRWSSWLLIAGLGGSLLCFQFFSIPFLFSFCYTFLAMAFTGLTGLAIAGHFKAILLNPALRHLGKISYGVYLIHPAVFLVFQSHHLLNRMGLAERPYAIETVSALMALSLSIGLASLSWSFFESRVLSLKQQLAP